MEPFKIEFSLILAIIFAILIGYYSYKYIKHLRRKYRKIPSKTSADKELRLLDIERAEINKEIFIIETLLKFLPASLLTIFISTIYVGGQDYTFFGVTIINLIIIIMTFLFILVIFLLLRSSELYKILYPRIREIEYLEKVSGSEKIKNYEDQIKKVKGEKTVIVKEKQELQKELERQQELARKMMEDDYIIRIDRIISELNNESINSQRNSALKFKEICHDGIIHKTDNKKLIDKIKEYFSIITLTMDDEILKIIIGGFHSLIMNSEKCNYLNMAEKELYDFIKEFMTTQDVPDWNYKNKIHHIFCNIAQPDDIDLVLVPFQHLQDGSGGLIEEYRDHTAYSLLVFKYKDTVLNKIIQILDSGEITKTEYYIGLEQRIISTSEISIIKNHHIPRCLRKE